MKHPVLVALAEIAPSIHFGVHVEPDSDSVWDVVGDLDPDDFKAWQYDVSATVIAGGEFVEGHAYMGGSWEKFGDNPREVNPDIGGYLLQMLEEAATELRSVVGPGLGDLGEVGRQLSAALAYLKAQMIAAYERQCAPA